VSPDFLRDEIDAGHRAERVAISPAQLAAENLFLRKQLALYFEREVKSRRADNAVGMIGMRNVDFSSIDC